MWIVWVVSLILRQFGYGQMVTYSRSMAGVVKIAGYIWDGSNFWVLLLLVQLASY